LKGEKMFEASEKFEAMDLKGLVKRLKNQKKIDYEYYLNLGREQGREHSKILDLHQFNELMKKHDEYLPDPENPEPGWEAKVVIDSTVYDRVLCFHMDDIEAGNFEIISEAYLVGWLRGVVEVWDMIKDEI
jgi:hypothetical protein